MLLKFLPSDPITYIKTTRAILERKTSFTVLSHCLSFDITPKRTSEQNLLSKSVDYSAAVSFAFWPPPPSPCFLFCPRSSFRTIQPGKNALTYKVCFNAHCYKNSLLHNWILSYSHLFLFRFTHCSFAFATMRRSFTAVTTRQTVRTHAIFLSSYRTRILDMTTLNPVMQLPRPVIGFRYITKRWKPKMQWQYFFLPTR